MLTALGFSDRNDLPLTLVNSIWEACKEKSDSKHRGSLWRATSLLISLPGLHRALLHAIGEKYFKLIFIVL